MELCYLSLLCMVLNIKLSSAGTLPVYGKHHRVLYNDTSSLNINSRRFPDQDVIAPENFSYFFTDLSFRSGINGYILSGAADTLFQLDSNLNMVSNYEWERNSTLEEGCTRFNSPYLCKNYIRVLKKIPTHTNLLLVCGTIYDQIPQCRTIDISSGNLGNASNPVGAGDGLVTYFPDAAGFGEFIDIDGTENRFLSAVLQARNRDFVLSYQDVAFNDTTDPNTLQVSQLFKTRQNDDYWLRTPVTFVDYARVDYPQLRAPGDQDFYFVFLRETHTIFSSREPQEMIYSRVVRLCRNDPGSMSDNFFSNYIKARIFCQSRSPAENRTVNTLNYQYNAITSAKFNEEGRYYDTGLWNKKLYGAFISSSIGPRGTAICAYNANPLTMQGVYEAFRNVLDYTNRQNPMEVESNYLECSATSPRPDNIAGVQIESTHPITQIGENPLLIINDVTVTQILVDVKCVVTSADSTICRNQDILFLGTDRGKILKVVFATNDHQTRDIDPIIAEEIELDDGNAVNKMNMERIGTNDVIFAATDSKIYRIPLERCGRHGRTCSSCILSRDPYCVWNINSQQCEVSPFTLTGSGTSTVSSSYVQSIHSAATYPEIRFSEDVYVVTEANGMLTVTVVSNFSVSTNITLEITSSDGTARSGIDFEAVSRTLTIGPSQTQVTFDVTIRPNQVLDCSNRTFTLNMRGIGSTCVFVPDSQATVVIVDSNSMAIEFSSASYSMAEGDRFVNLTVERRIMNTMDVNFVISTESGSAVAPDDYSTLTASLLTFTANSGDGSITYTLPIVNDNLAEGDETFTVILALPSSINTCQDGGGITIGGISQAVVTILDDDYILIGFEVSNYTFTERSTTSSYGILIEKFGTNAVPITVEIRLESGSGSNRATSNDSSLVNTSVTFGPADVTKEVNVMIFSDEDVENTETFTLRLAVLPNTRVNLVPERNSTVINILDQDSVTIGFIGATNYNVSESSGTLNLTVGILSGSIAVPVVVTYSTIAGEASESDDYSIDSGTMDISFTPQGASSSTIRIRIINDNVFENLLESFSVVLATNDSKVLLDPQRTTALVNIMDANGVTLGFQGPSSISAFESDNSVDVTVVLQGKIAIEVDFYLSTVNGSAYGNEDFAPVTSQLLTFSGDSNAATQQYSIFLVDDQVLEMEETFRVVISTNDNRIMLQQNSVDITIRDNDDVYFGFESSSYTFSEGDRTRGIRITKFGFNAIPLNVAFTTKGNTAIQNDFNVTSSSNITFGKWDREYVINLTITQDNFFEGTESFFMTMMLSASSNSRVTVQRNSTEVYISDSSVLQIGFSSTVYTVMESRGSVQVTVTILNDISLNIPVSVHLQPSSCTAIAGIDFDGNAIPLTLDANGSSTFSANITIMDDDVLEASMEAFDITLAVNNSRIQVDPARSVARISIMDDDTNIFQFASRDYSIYESNCSVSLRIMRIGNSSIPVTLLLEISNITNTDYKYVQSRQQVVRFEPGEAYKEVDVSILVNTNENRNERFAASLLKDSNDERIVLNEWNTNVTILDDTYISCPTVTCPVPPTVRTFTTEALINVGGLEGDTSGSIYNSIGASVGVLIILLLIIVALAITVGILALFLCKKNNVIFKQKYNKKVIASPEDNPSKQKSPLPGDLELSTTYPNQGFCDCNSDSPPSGHNEMLEKTDLSSQKKEGETTEEDKSTFSTSHFLHVKRTSHELQHSDVSTTSSENSPPPDKNGSNTEVSSL